jgi:glc operon protein GlcG
MRKSIMLGIPLGLALLTAASAFAQLAEKKVITLAAARKMVAAAEAEAERNHWAGVIAVVDRRIALVTARDFIAMQGGLPIVVGGQVIGGIGASFDTPEHDVQVAQAGLAALKHDPP